MHDRVSDTYKFGTEFALYYIRKDNLILFGQLITHNKKNMNIINNNTL